jgi:hypothetical protein
VYALATVVFGSSDDGRGHTSEAAVAAPVIVGPHGELRRSRRAQAEGALSVILPRTTGREVAGLLADPPGASLGNAPAPSSTATASPFAIDALAAPEPPRGEGRVRGEGDEPSLRWAR